MKNVLKYHYVNVLDSVKVHLAQLQPYFDKVKKTAFSYLVRLAIVTVLIMVALWVVKSTWLHFTNQKLFLVSPATFTFETPDWVTDRFIEKIRNIHGLKIKYNIFEKDLTKKIAEVYEKSSLVSQVVSVQRKLPNMIKIKLELRRPIAIVKRKSEEYLVDKECVRLIRDLYKFPEKEGGQIYIVDNRRLKVPDYGEKWNNRSVEEGVNLLNYLKYNKIDELFKIATIDVSRIDRRKKNGRSDIILWTKNGTMIKWGSQPSPENLHELSNFEKLQNLLSVANEEGTDLSNLEYVDVRWKTPIAKRTHIQ